MSEAKSIDLSRLDHNPTTHKYNKMNNNDTITFNFPVYLNSKRGKDYKYTAKITR